MSAGPEIVRADAALIDARPVSPSRWERLWRVGKILIVFACVGPPVGALAVTALMIVAMFFESKGADAAGLGLLILIGGIFYGYVVGIIPAAVVGAVVGLRQVYFGGASWRFALGVGVCSGLLIAVVLGKATIDWHVVTMFCVATISATFVCWRIVRRWYLDGAIEGRLAT